jgi:uncharacterized protein (TIGR03067 family)
MIRPARPTLAEVPLADLSFIERKTAKETKTLDLEVHKKAGDLSAVKVGDKISFCYDPNLELVIKIGGEGEPDKASGTDAEEAIAKALKELQGEWLMTAGEENGQQFERADVKRQNRRLLIKGKTLTMERLKGSVAKWTGKFTINPETNDFDWVGTNSQGAENKWVGIYEVDGDTLKLCFRFNIDGQAKRPTKFSSGDFEKPNATAFYTFKRDDD